MNLVFKTLILASLILPLREAKAVPLGPFDVTLELCQNIQFVTNIINAWSQAAFPVTGQPGFVMMVVQRTNPIMDVCNFMNQLKNASTTEAIFLTAEKLNDVTEKKWNDYLRLSKRTYSIANSVYDLNTGKKRKGTVVGTAMAQELGDFYRQVVDLSTGQNPDAVNKRNREAEAERIKVQGDLEKQKEKERKIAEFAQIARDRAILKEGTNCPGGIPKAPDYEEKVKGEYQPWVIQKANTDTDVAFTKSQLIDFGGVLFNEVEAVAGYQDDVQKLFVLGVSYVVKQKENKVKTVRPTGKTNADDTAEKKEEDLKQVVQEFRVKVNKGVFSKFIQKYDPRFRKWAAAEWDKYSGHPDGKLILKEQYKRLAYFCGESELRKEYKYTNNTEPYETKKIELYKRCEERVQVTRDAFINLMSDLVKNLEDVLTKNKDAQAKLWSFESEHLGRQRSISQTQTGNTFQEEVVCIKQPEAIDLEMIQAKQQAVNARYNEVMASEVLKDSMLRDQEIEKQKELAEEIRIKRQVIEKKNEEESKAQTDHKSLSLGGAVGGG